MMHLRMLPIAAFNPSPLGWQDWIVIVAFLLISISIGLLFTTKAGKSVEDYFVSGRSLPWWLAGTSMVATTFAADTPLAIAEAVRKYGIYDNWYWWALGFGAVLSTVLLSRLWRRSRVKTDIELIELRYDGRGAHVLRGFRAVYFGVLGNLVTMAWVSRAMLSIASQSTHWGTQTETGAFTLVGGDKILMIAALLALAGVYSIFSGLWGVVATDFFQFIIAMVGAVALAVFAVNEVGGLEVLRTRIPADTLRIVPAMGEGGSGLLDGLGGALGIFLIYIGLHWWNDKTIDQGGYLAQRLLSCKSENHALGASMWFCVACYALRPWPWIVAGLASMLLIPTLSSDMDSYTMLAMGVMGPWWKGLLIASLLAAFISTINTQINWGASYLLNDLYQRYMVKDRPARHYVWMGRWFSLGLLVAAGVASYYVTSILAAWKFFSLLATGSGVVLLGRWLWWRVNAYSELSALAAAFVATLTLTIYLKMTGHKMHFTHQLLIVLPVVTVTWLTTTFLTAPVPQKKLAEFARRIRPPGPGWGPVHRAAGTQPPSGVLARTAGAWLGGVGLVFGTLFAIGKLLLAGWQSAWPFAAAAVIGGVLFFYLVPRGEADAGGDKS